MLSLDDKMELRKDFQAKTDSVSRDPEIKQLFDGQFLWVKQRDGTKLLKVMEGGKIKQVYVNADSKVYIEV